MQCFFLSITRCRSILADPTAEEEDLGNCNISVVLNEKSEICAILKPGGASISEEKLRDCIEKTKLRHQQVMQILQPL
jgi:exosome complex RNA-binding protein Rrp42 (RNase PH superfamily)